MRASSVSSTLTSIFFFFGTQRALGSVTETRIETGYVFRYLHSKKDCRGVNNELLAVYGMNWQAEEPSRGD